MDDRYGQHDDRSRGPTRRGGYRGRGRPRYSRGGRGGQGREINPRSRLEDDHDMGEEGMSGGHRQRLGRPSYDEAGGSVFKRLGGNKASGGRGGVFNRLSGMGSKPGGDGGGGGGSSWHKVTVLNGANESREWLMRQLSSRSSEKFEAVGEHVLGDKFMFFTAEPGAAMELKQMGSIESRNGTLQVLVKPSGPPRGSRGAKNSEQRPSLNHTTRVGGDDDISMQEDSKDTIVRVLGQRYDPATKSLDLSNMYNDPAFKQANLTMSMFNRSVVTSILSLVGQYCPKLLCLNLSNNRLQRLEMYSELTKMCPELETLNLCDNQLSYPAEMNHLVGLKNLTTLSLMGNPLAERSDRDVISYSSSFRKLFPALKQLDGRQLSSPVKFDLPVMSGSLPSVQKSFFTSDEVKKVITTFLEQYYVIYDQEPKEKLLTAYSSDAVFSLSVCTDGPKFHGMKEYIVLSRNLKKIPDTGKRMTMLKRGQLDVVQFLRGLPRTVHYSKSFIVDCLYSTSQQTAFVVNGLFSELDGRSSGSNPAIQFTRTFVISHIGTGVTITNDQLTLRGATEKFIQSIQGTVSQEVISPAHGSIQGAVKQEFSSSAQGISEEQMRAIQTLAAQSRMNLEYSKRCLAENEWDYNKALTVFTVLQSQQKIPHDAFL
ncbi:nuclear RNA export factor 1-like isoform X2 [Halichondria panicea]|uniref:nuclear RNA export factor 1-like isoform X2 n=1 Tax=Halichondria panicea TaxID=6063 RepID=UPI00312B7ACF